MRLILVLLLAAVSVSAAPYVEERLSEVIAEGDRGEFITVSIFLDRQVTDAEKARVPKWLDRDERRAEFVALYKRIAEESQGPLIEYLEELQGRGEVGYIRPHWITNTVVVEIIPSAAAGLTSRNDIAALHISEAHEGSFFDMTDYGTTSGKGRDIGWGLTKIGAPTIWETPYNFTGEDIVVAVIDMGCRYTHYDLRDHLWVNEDEIPDNGIDDDDNGYIDDTLGWDFGFPHEEGDDNDPWFWEEGGSAGHGTMTTGIVGSDGTAGNFCGVAPDALLMIIRVPAEGEGADERTWTAMEYMTDNGADVVSGSGGANYAEDPDYFSWRQATENMLDAGVVGVAAAGNEYENQDENPIPHNIMTPADVPDGIGVGGTDSDDVIAYFSSTGPVEWDLEPPYDDYPWPPGLTKPDVTGPTIGIMCPWFTGDADYFYGGSGTSAATPHVGGLCALMLEADPTLTPEEIKQYLEDYALELGPAGKDNRYGSGRIRAVETIEALNANGHPDHFSILSPGDGELVPPGDVEFTWESTTDPDGTIDSYTLRISEESNFRTYTDYEDIPGTSTTVDLGKGTYYWKVKAIDNEDGYTWCDERRFELVVTGYEDVVVYGFNAKPAGDGILVYWSADDTQLTGFNLYRTVKTEKRALTTKEE
ncbi:MAG: S8 family serine peptidase, partial [Candidatus Coatesbacteria bacterium]